MVRHKFVQTIGCCSCRCRCSCLCSSDMTWLTCHRLWSTGEGEPIDLLNWHCRRRSRWQYRWRQISGFADCWVYHFWKKSLLLLVRLLRKRRSGSRRCYGHSASVGRGNRRRFCCRLCGFGRRTLLSVGLAALLGLSSAREHTLPSPIRSCPAPKIKSSSSIHLARKETGELPGKDGNDGNWRKSSGTSSPTRKAGASGHGAPPALPHRPPVSSSVQRTLQLKTLLCQVRTRVCQVPTLICQIGFPPFLSVSKTNSSFIGDGWSS